MSGRRPAGEPQAPAPEPCRLRVGCSGWQYRHWKDTFYHGLPQARWFAEYARSFTCVELNSPFYHWPPEATFRRWRDLAPAGFGYVVKAPRFATHVDRLADARRLVPELVARAQTLGGTFIGMLWQFPPSLRFSRERLDRILAAMPRDHRHAFEFRHASWHVPEVHAALDAHACGSVVHDHRTGHAPAVVVGGVAYLRLHGWHADLGSYPDTELARWARWLTGAADGGARTVCAFFNNDLHTAAPRNALTLAALLRELGETAGGRVRTPTA